MKFRERIAHYILLRHIEEMRWESHNDGSNMGTTYFKIDPKWLNLAKRVGGCSYKDIILKAVSRN